MKTLELIITHLVPRNKSYGAGLSGSVGGEMEEKVAEFGDDGDEVASISADPSPGCSCMTENVCPTGECGMDVEQALEGI